VPTPVWDGRKLPVSSTIAGAAIVELANTTIVVPRDFTLDVDAYGAFVVHSGERGAESARQLEGVRLP
jgi:N-methylhydantoinase A